MLVVFVILLIEDYFVYVYCFVCVWVSMLIDWWWVIVEGNVYLWDYGRFYEVVFELNF